MLILRQRRIPGAKQVARKIANGQYVIVTWGRRSGKTHFARKVNINLAKIRRLRKGRP